HSITYLLPV
nr:Chain P, pep-V [synthetic construct]3UPR_Q Chain Q, pep-V [synthetic construct]